MKKKECLCDEINELNGIEAQKYARDHLIKLSVNPQTWEISYKCPEKDILWILDFPFSEMHGGGPHRLRKIHNNEVC